MLFFRKSWFRFWSFNKTLYEGNTNVKIASCINIPHGEKPAPQIVRVAQAISAIRLQGEKSRRLQESQCEDFGRENYRGKNFRCINFRHEFA